MTRIQLRREIRKYIPGFVIKGKSTMSLINTWHAEELKYERKRRKKVTSQFSRVRKKLGLPPLSRQQYKELTTEEIEESVAQMKASIKSKTSKRVNSGNTKYDIQIQALEDLIDDINYLSASLLRYKGRSPAEIVRSAIVEIQIVIRELDRDKFNNSNAKLFQPTLTIRQPSEIIVVDDEVSEGDNESYLDRLPVRLIEKFMPYYA